MINNLFSIFQNFINSWSLYLKDTLGWKNIFEVLIIVSILMVFYQKFIRNTHSEKFVKGAIVLVFMWVISELLIALDLTIIGGFLKSIVIFVALSLIVIPRSRSISIVSRSCACISRCAIVPVASNNLSAKVDLPWSMCAIMQKFRTLSLCFIVVLLYMKHKFAQNYMLKIGKIIAFIIVL